MNKYTLASHCYGAILGHDVVLLDLAQCQKERQYVLLKNGAPVASTILAESRSEFDAPDIEQSIEAMSNAGWIVDTSATEEPAPFASTVPSPSRIRRPFWLPLGLHGGILRLEALFLLRRIAGLLQENAFLPLVSTLVSLPAYKSSADDPRVPPILQAVQDAARIPHEPMTCLHQSLAICWMLRARGINAHVVIRVQQNPLLAHMIVVDGARILSWKPGLVSVTTLEHFLSATCLLFHSGELHRHFYGQEGDIDG